MQTTFFCFVFCFCFFVVVVFCFCFCSIRTSVLLSDAIMFAFALFLDGGYLYHFEYKLEKN